MSEEKLAICGGTPVRTRPWPSWPRADVRTEELVLDVVRSGQWTVSSPYVGRQSYERRFAAAFAEYNDVEFCLPVANGSAALTVAMQAMNIGSGDEVLVPGLSWVACASSVSNLGAKPVFVDVDPGSLCMSISDADNAITSRTKAIMLVHFHGGLADVDRFAELAAQHDLRLLEDCSQAHGAKWKGAKVGTFGDAGVFSMHQSKLLTCGEGGAIITRDEDLYSRMQELHADGRVYSGGALLIGDLQLEDSGKLVGRNFILSELQAAVLTDRLSHLDREIATRDRNAVLLTGLARIRRLGEPLFCPSPNAKPTHFRFCIRVHEEIRCSAGVDRIAAALTAELGFPVLTVEEPLDSHPLYRPPYRGLDVRSMPSANLASEESRLKESTRAWKECIALPHQVLLGESEDMDDVAEAMRKVSALHHQLFQQTV